jgi:hypothetical protein
VIPLNTVLEKDGARERWCLKKMVLEIEFANRNLGDAQEMVREMLEV